MICHYTGKELQCLSYKVFQIGKNIKATKLKHQWAFSYNNTKHYLNLFISKLTAKTMLLLDERILIPKQKLKKALKVSFQMKNDSFVLRQSGNDFELAVNDILFLNLIGTLPCATPFCASIKSTGIVVLNHSDNQSSHNKRYSEIEIREADSNAGLLIQENKT